MTLEPKPQSDELVVGRGRTRRLAYTPEFKDFLSSRKHVFKKFNELTRGLKRRGEKRQEEDLELELLGLAVATSYYKLKIGDATFFVKVIDKANTLTGGGFLEIVSMDKAKNILKEKGIDWAEVVDYKLGYDDGKNKYFVSEWRDCLQISMKQYLDSVGEYYVDPNPPKSTIDFLRKFHRHREDLLDKLKMLKKVLGDHFFDVWDYNMSYDPESKKIYIFDLQDKQLRPK